MSRRHHEGEGFSSWRRRGRRGQSRSHSRDVERRGPRGYATHWEGRLARTERMMVRLLPIAPKRSGFSRSPSMPRGRRGRVEEANAERCDFEERKRKKGEVGKMAPREPPVVPKINLNPSSGALGEGGGVTLAGENERRMVRDGKGEKGSGVRSGRLRSLASLGPIGGTAGADPR